MLTFYGSGSRFYRRRPKCPSGEASEPHAWRSKVAARSTPFASYVFRGAVDVAAIRSTRRRPVLAAARQSFPCLLLRTAEHNFLLRRIPVNRRQSTIFTFRGAAPQDCPSGDSHRLLAGLVALAFLNFHLYGKIDFRYSFRAGPECGVCQSW